MPAGRRRARPADRLPARGRALARPLVQGAQNGVMDEPPVVVYMQASEPPVVDRLDSAGKWRAETAWPAPGASERVLHLAADGALADESGGDGADSLAYHPAVGVTGGLWSGGIQFGLPGDQRPDEALSLTYTSKPLDEDCDPRRPTAELVVRVERVVIGFCVSLSDVRPDGSSHLVAKGMRNATRRRSLTDPVALPPNRPSLPIDLDATGWIFPRGHRIRVSIANADFPNVWPTPELASSEVPRGAAAPSHVVLPLVPAAPSSTAPTYRPSPVVVERQADTAEPPTWRVSRDMLSGRAEVEIAIEADVRVNETTLVRRSFAGTMRVDRDDPARASAFGRHRGSHRASFRYHDVHVGSDDPGHGRALPSHGHGRGAAERLAGLRAALDRVRPADAALTGRTRRGHCRAGRRGAEALVVLDLGSRTPSVLPNGGLCAMLQAFREGDGSDPCRRFGSPRRV